MTPRDRYVQTLLFGKPDKIPFAPGGGRKSTRENWHKQGLPENVKSIDKYAYEQAGGRQELPGGGEGFKLDQRMIPQFEEKVIERRERTQIVQDWKGNICEISNEYSTEYLRSAIDFVTRRWVKCPVENRADWEDMKKRYDPDEPSRFPLDAEQVGKRLADRTWPVTISFHGPFWQLREWLGFESLCILLHEDPDFAMEMIDFWKDYVGRLMQKAFKYFTPDCVHLSEDMAFKGFSMISPKMARRFLLPSYIYWGELIRKARVPVYAMDSDGFIGELIPIWIESGINVCDPIEVAAGNDIVAFRRQFGKNMGYRGGVDKRAIAKGGKVIEEEMERIDPVIKDGGYIPSCDHGVPADVSWPNFVYYCKLLAKATGWL